MAGDLDRETTRSSQRSPRKLYDKKSSLNFRTFHIIGEADYFFGVMLHGGVCHLHRPHIKVGIR